MADVPLNSSSAEFDAFCRSYRSDHEASIKASGYAVEFFAEYKARDARRLADAAGCAVTRLLDFGSGIGNAVPYLRQAFPGAKLTCLDVSSDSLRMSRALHGDELDYLAYDGCTLPFAPGSFDLAFTACVFHHIDADMHVNLLKQIRIALKPEGIFVLYEHNPYNPLTRRAVAACPFDEHAVLISAPEMKRRLRAAGFGSVSSEYRMFFPRFLARARFIEPLLKGVPLGAQYVVGACP